MLADADAVPDKGGGCAASAALIAGLAQIGARYLFPLAIIASLAGVRACAIVAGAANTILLALALATGAMGDDAAARAEAGRTAAHRGFRPYFALRA
jgi:hypothetical protein